ncbi:MAG: LUD domain-containing protein [Williamsia sp.]|nr:LUD domain-containing protein [Williamsia sp.]
MNPREKVLAAISKNQPPARTLPSLAILNPVQFEDRQAKFIATIEGIGAKVQSVENYAGIERYIPQHFTEGSRYVTTVNGLTQFEQLPENQAAHTLENIEVAIIPGIFAVAENGAIWITQREAGNRVLPFICQHLAIVLASNQIVDNMHMAYERIGASQYDFGVFIAGPSKTADIEQSLVLGAHGPRSLVVFLVG